MGVLDRGEPLEVGGGDELPFGAQLVQDGLDVDGVPDDDCVADEREALGLDALVFGVAVAQAFWSSCGWCSRGSLRSLTSSGAERLSASWPRATWRSAWSTCWARIRGPDVRWSRGNGVIERTGYPRFRRLATAQELASFSPTEDEVRWARARARSGEHLLALMISLMCFERLRYFPTAMTSRRRSLSMCGAVSNSRRARPRRARAEA